MFTETWIDLETIAQGEVTQKEEKQTPFIIPTFWPDLPCPTRDWGPDTYEYAVAQGSQPPKDLMLL